MPTRTSTFRLSPRTLLLLDTLVTHAAAKDPTQPYAQSRTGMLVRLIENQIQAQGLRVPLERSARSPGFR
jgi:hypothetical protein